MVVHLLLLKFSIDVIYLSLNIFLILFSLSHVQFEWDNSVAVDEFLEIWPPLGNNFKVRNSNSLALKYKIIYRLEQK